MAFLEWCELWRRGITARYMTQEKYAVVGLDTGGPLDGRKADRGITLTTEIASKGGGTTQIRLFIDAGGFHDLAGAMVASAPDAAMKAFGSAIAHHARDPITTKRLVLPSGT